MGGANTTTGTGGALLGTGLQWAGQGANAIKGGVDTTNTGFTNAVDAKKASTTSGIGSLLGLGMSALGKGGAFASGGALSFLEEGGAIDDIGMDGGGAVPVGMSPSGGAAIDDIDAVAPGGPARLNAGEFVMPKEATSWYGEKFFQNLIKKAEAEKAGAGAKPETKPTNTPAEPTFQPRPQAASQGALPV